MSRLTGPQMGQLQRTMLDAFTLQDLESLLLFRLDRRLDQIASSSGNLSTATLAVIQAANREGWIADLLRAVREERSNSQELQTLVAELLAHVEPTAPSTGLPGASTAATTGSKPAAPPGKPTVFISYSHADEDWKNRLVKQLDVLKGIGVLEPWDDRKIGAGLDWKPEIEKAMDRAAVAVLLISADFLTSDFIKNEEAPRLLARRGAGGLRVIPVIVKPCPWKFVPWLQGMLARPTDGRPLSQSPDADADLAAIAEEIAGIIMEAGASS